MNIQDGIISYKTEHSRRLGYKVTARISYYSYVLVQEFDADTKDREMSVIRNILKRNIDAEMAKYARKNPVSDGYVTITTEEYADLIGKKHEYDSVYAMRYGKFLDER